jgi:sphinganine-1-phosphate aldolase
MTVPLVDTFISDLQAAVEEARINPSCKGTMVSIYGPYSSIPVLPMRSGLDFNPGLGNSSVVGPTMVGQLATAFLDTLYKA